MTTIEAAIEEAQQKANSEGVKVYLTKGVDNYVHIFLEGSTKGKTILEVFYPVNWVR